MNRKSNETFIKNNGTIEHKLILTFVGNGQVSFENNNNYWMGNWTSNDGKLYLKFENNTINEKRLQDTKK